MMRHVMLDLETLGVSPGCTILSIGAAEFDRDGLKASFYGVISRASCRAAGLHEDPDTKAWWLRQSPEARETLDEATDKNQSVSLGRVLFQFDFWLSQVAGLDDPERKGVAIWGNGADFDQPILAEAYRRAGHELPWATYNSRCYRTLKNLRPNIMMVRKGTHHSARSDAQSQADHASRLLTDLEGWR